MKNTIIPILTLIMILAALISGCSVSMEATTTQSTAKNTQTFTMTDTKLATTVIATVTATKATATPTGSGPTIDNDRDGIDDLVENQIIKKFAPLVKINPEEQYLPANIPWFLSRVRMRFDISLGLDKQVLNKGEVNLSNLTTQSYNNIPSGLSPNPTNFFLEATDIAGGGSLDDYRKKTRAGVTSLEWVCYARVHYSPGNSGNYDIQYIFYYPYNGDMVSGPLNTAHESDFEHITVRVKQDQKTISQVYYAAHDNEGKWYNLQIPAEGLSGYSVTTEGRLLVYAALNSHASYPWAGKWTRNNLPDDHAAGDGPIWDCQQSVQNLGEKEYPAKDMQWIQYSGHWGEVGTQSFTTGPVGPAYQQWWYSDPE
jgi:hypothetical protein